MLLIFCLYGACDQQILLLEGSCIKRQTKITKMQKRHVFDFYSHFTEMNSTSFIQNMLCFEQRTYDID